FANLTITATNNNSQCSSQRTVQVFQNTFPPISNIAAQNPAITCITSSVILANQSISGIPISVFPITMPVIGYMWFGPTPQPSAALSSTYVAITPGTYTLIAKDLNNGCMRTATRTISDD